MSLQRGPQLVPLVSLLYPNATGRFPCTMVQKLPPAAGRSNAKLEYLQPLAIIHYVLGGFSALLSLFPIVHLAFGLAILGGGVPLEGPHPEEARFVGSIFVIVGGLIIVLGLTYSALVIMAGRYLQKRRGHTFCVVMAAIQCLNIPLGTILGVFTLVVITKPEVKAAFEENREAGLTPR